MKYPRQDRYCSGAGDIQLAARCRQDMLASSVVHSNVYTTSASVSYSPRLPRPCAAAGLIIFSAGFTWVEALHLHQVALYQQNDYLSSAVLFRLRGGPMVQGTSKKRAAQVRTVTLLVRAGSTNRLVGPLIVSLSALTSITS